MTNETALQLNGSLAHCYLYQHGITEKIRREHLERVSQSTELQLLSATETVEAINADTSIRNEAGNRVIHGVVDARAIPDVQRWAKITYQREFAE